MKASGINGKPNGDLRVDQEFWCGEHVLEYKRECKSQLEMHEWLVADSGPTDDEFSGAFIEGTLNGGAIDWVKWVHRLSSLTAAEAARLMSGLDPDLHAGIEHKPDEHDQSMNEARNIARMLERLASDQGMASGSPEEWLEWADRELIEDGDAEAGERSLFVHPLYRIEVEKLKARPKRQVSQGEAPNQAGGASGGESARQRQARRYQACINAGLAMPSDDYSHLPRGIGALAKSEGVTRQAFSEDVKAHIRRANGR